MDEERFTLYLKKCQHDLSHTFLIITYKISVFQFIGWLYYGG